MKIIKFQAENIKRIGAVEIEPTGFLVPITGPNDSGKSSVLDAIFYALAGAKTHPAEPIKRGAETARIRLDLGEIIVTRKFTLTSTSLTVEAADGAQYKSPQQMLDKMLGALSFDPLDFSRMAPAEQLEQLRQLVQLDVDVDALDAANLQDRQARADLNREMKSTLARFEEISVPEGLVDELADEKQLLDEMGSVAEFNRKLGAERDKIARHRAHVAGLCESATTLRERAEKYRAEAAKLEREADVTADTAEKFLAEVDAMPAVPDDRDVSDLRRQVEQARVNNEWVMLARKRKSLRDEADALARQSQEITARMEGREDAKAEALARAKMPIPGLSFNDATVLFNDLPLDQASSAQQLRVATAIAMAANPTLRVIRIKDGSLLDGKSLAMLGEIARQEDFQVWVEMVDTTGKFGVVMHDGSVIGTTEFKTDGPEATTEPAPKKRRKITTAAEGA